jgi:hypothetical protein
VPRPSKLSPEQWNAVRLHWQGSDKPGFGWLASAVRAAWGIDVLPQALSQAARLKGWAKGGEPHPLDPNIQPDANNPTDPNIPVKPQRPPRAPSGAGAGALPSGSGSRAIATVPQAPGHRSGPTLEAADDTSAGADQRPAEPRPSRIRGVPAADPAAHGVKRLDPVVLPNGAIQKYRPEYADMLLAFFDTPTWRSVEIKVGPELSKVVQEPTPFPTFERFAHTIGVNLNTLRDWALKQDKDGAPRHPEFAYAFARARDLQRARTVEGSLAGVYEPRAASLALKNVAGWRDQPEESREVSPVNDADLALAFVKAMDAARARQEEIRTRRAALLAADGFSG